MWERFRDALSWIWGLCPLCYSLGRVLSEPDALPTERYYVPCQLCMEYMPQNVARWRENDDGWDYDDMCDIWDDDMCDDDDDWSDDDD